MKTIFITGGSGFVGKNLIEYFKDKYHVLSPSHKELDLLDTESTNNFFKKNTIDVVIHCAVVGGSRPEENENNSLNKNLRMFFNIINNKSKFKKMIFIGSGAEYDKSTPLINVKEEDFDKKIPFDEYGFFKYVCSKYIDNLDNTISLRVFGLFGKHEDYRYRFISNAICQNLAGLPITINQNVYFDYVYINDFVRIVDYFINNKVKYKFYNVGTGNKIDLIMIAKLINKIAKNKSEIKIINSGYNNEYSCNNTRLISELGKNFAFTKIDESIKSLFNWYENK